MYLKFSKFFLCHTCIATIYHDVGKSNDKSSISDMFKIDNNITKEPNVIADKFCKYFTEIGEEFASKIPNSQVNFEHHLKQPNIKSLYLSPTDPIEI